MDSILKTRLIFGNNARFIILALCTICLMAMMSNVLTFSFTVICMDNVTKNDTGHWLYSPGHRNALFSAVAVGSILGTLPLLYCVHKIGMKKTLLIYGISSSLATGFFPFAVKIGFPLTFLLRLIQGLSVGVLFSATGAISTSWSPLTEMGTYLAILSSHVQLAPMITMPISAYFCDKNNWEWVFHYHGIFSLFLFLIFFGFFQNHPIRHNNVGQTELSKITNGKAERLQRGPVPYKDIFTNPTIIGCMLTSCGGNIGFYILLYYGPSYISKGLGYDLQATGLATALPWVFAAIMKFIAGPLYDTSTFISEKCRVLLFASCSQLAMIFSLLIISYTDNARIAQIAYSLAIIFNGLNIVGGIKCAQLVARKYVHVVMAMISMIANITTLLSPAIVAILCPEETSNEWSRLFFILSIIVAVCNIPFIFTVTTEPAEWTNSNWNVKKNCRLGRS